MIQIVRVPQKYCYLLLQGSPSRGNFLDPGSRVDRRNVQVRYEEMCKYIAAAVAGEAEEKEEEEQKKIR
jgi:hypothetical protein